MKKLLCAALALALALCSVPAALASEYFSARTTLSGSSSAKLNNISLAVSAINGWSLNYGETFSFNDAVGPRTGAYGYQDAVNGRGVKVTGGGVAQVATTLYLALLKQGGAYFDELETYGKRFTDNYVSDGDQAVITDYAADTDFRFTNYANDMFIEMWITDNYLYCAVQVDSDSSDSGWNWGDGGDDDGTLISSAVVYSDASGNLLNNITLAADSATDTTLYSYDTFSFNDIVGPRTEGYGYKSAINGRGVKVTGGGVAQVASAIWMAIQNLSDIDVLEKRDYGDRYNQSYVSSSRDAVVTDYNAGTDFSFRYTGSGSITLYTYVSDGDLHCDIYQND